MGIEVKRSSLKVLKQEALTGFSSAKQIFQNAPKDVEVIHLTVRTQGLTISPCGLGMKSAGFEGVAPTASSVGIDFGVNSTTTPYEFQLDYSEALKYYAIEQASTATAYAVYYKRVNP